MMGNINWTNTEPEEKDIWWNLTLLVFTRETLGIWKRCIFPFFNYMGICSPKNQTDIVLRKA